jgi:hypothetical protein
MLAAAAACSSDAPTSALAPGAAEAARLRQWERSEQERVRQEAARSLAAADSLASVAASRGLLGGVTDLLNGATGLLLCRPLTYSGNVGVIGPEGGSLTIGQHRLVIPPGALDRPVVITGEIPVSLSVGVRLSPHGLRFRRQATLTLDYSHCLLPMLLRESVAYTDEELNVLEWPRSVDRTRAGEVDAYIDHFSRYVVAYRR